MKQKHTYIPNEETYYSKAQSKRGIKKDGDPRHKTVEFINENLKKQASVLEIGCGVSDIFYFLSPDINYFGVDPSQFSIKELENLNLNLRLSVGYAENIPFENNKFDAVFSFQVLEHLFDPRQSLLEMIRVVRSGGYIIVSAPNLECPWSMPNAVRHYSKIRTFVLMIERFVDLFLRNFGILKFRMIKQNYTQWSGKFEKSDDDLTHITSAYEVATFLKRNGCRQIYSREPKCDFGLKCIFKKVIRKIPVLQYYDSGMYLIFKKT